MTFSRLALVTALIAGVLPLAARVDVAAASAPSPPAPAPAAAPASRPVQVELGLKNVRVEHGEHSDLANGPHLISVPPIYPSRVSDAWVEATSPHSVRGAGNVLGYFGVGRFEARSYSRSGETLTLTLRRLPGPHGAGATYVWAMLPPLPDGTYTFRCLLQDEHGNQPGRNLHAEARCTISLPDPSIAEAQRAVARLRAMSPAELLREYEAAGTVVRPTDAEMIGRAVPIIGDERQRRWGRVNGEVIRRGSAIVPEVMEFLKREVPRNADDFHPGNKFGFARPLMEALTRIRDPRCVPLLVDIVDGYRGKANRPLRWAALEALRKLTYTSFDKPRPHDGFYYHEYAVEHPSAAPRKPGGDSALSFADQAARYREWLAGEGREPSQWLPVALQRARKLLEGDDLDAAYCAATFSDESGFPRDDDPNRTVARIGDILENARALPPGESKEVRYEYRGRPFSVSLDDWTNLLCRYGPRARPYVKTLLRLYPRYPDRFLIRIGGEEAVAYLVKRLENLDRRLTDAGIDPRTDWDEVNDEKLRQLVLAHHTCRWAVHRWTGRTFPHTADVLKWWEANWSKTEEQWLREGLDATAAAADAGDAELHPCSDKYCPTCRRARGSRGRTRRLSRLRGSAV